MRNYDQDPIVVYTSYSYEQCKQFQRICLRKRKKNSIILLVVTLAYIVFTLFNYATTGYALNTSLQVIISFLLVYEGYLVFTYNGSFYTPKVHKKYENDRRGGSLYEFLDDHYISSGEDGDYKIMKNAPYDDVLTIVETDTMLYLYTNPTRAQLVDKEGIQHNSSTPNELSTFLREKFKDAKYEFVG